MDAGLVRLLAREMKRRRFEALFIEEQPLRPKGSPTPTAQHSPPLRRRSGAVVDATWMDACTGACNEAWPLLGRARVDCKARAMRVWRLETVVPAYASRNARPACLVRCLSAILGTLRLRQASASYTSPAVARATDIRHLADLLSVSCNGTAQLQEPLLFAVPYISIVHPALFVPYIAGPAILFLYCVPQQPGQ